MQYYSVVSKESDSLFKVEIPKEKYNSVATKYNFRKEEFKVDYSSILYSWKTGHKESIDESEKILDCVSVEHPRFRTSHGIKLVKNVKTDDYNIISLPWPKTENLDYTFENIKTIYSDYLEKVYNKNDMFLLHIDFLPIMDYFFKADNDAKDLPLFNSKLLGFKEYIKFQIPECYENIINEDNVKILLMVTYEPFHHEKNFDWDVFYNLTKLLPEKFILLTSEGRSTSKKHIPTMYAAFNASVLKLRTYEKDINNKREKILKKIKHKWYGLSLNRITKPHRLLMCNYFSENLNSKIDYSMGLVLSGEQWQHTFTDEKNYNINHWGNQLKELYEHKDKISDSQIQHISKIKKWIFDHGEKFVENEYTTMAHDDKDFMMFTPCYLNSCFNIINETYYFKTDQYTTFLTEKTFRAMMFFQPFIIVGQSDSIKLLRELGFDVFDDYIDHRYDTLKFFIDRIEYAQSEITRLCNISLNEWTEILYELYPRLLKNFNLLNSHFVNQNITTNPIKLKKPKKLETVYYKNKKFHINDILVNL